MYLIERPRSKLYGALEAALQSEAELRALSSALGCSTVDPSRNLEVVIPRCGICKTFPAPKCGGRRWRTLGIWRDARSSSP
jgi:hypothetical protein